MRTFLILFGKELRAFFFSPVAYVVLGLVMVLNGFAFNASVSFLQREASGGSLVKWTFDSPWFYLTYFAIFPLITMRLFAEERRQGTLETLLTAPVAAWQLVTSKFSAAVVFYAVLWLPSLINFFVFQYVTAGAADLPPGALKGSYIIVFAMGLFNISLGCLASSLTSNQMIAAITTLTFTIIHYLLGLFGSTAKRLLPPSSEEVVDYFSSVTHLQTFTSGLLDTRALVYYGSLSILFLVLTHQVVEFRRWKS